MDKQRNKSLLIVDDQQDNLFVLSQVIQEFLPHCELHTTTRAEQGLELAVVEKPDVVLIDVQMPGMGGIELCRRLKRNVQTARVPIILITSHETSSARRAAGLDAGADDFLVRPIDNVEIVARLKAALRIKAAEDELRLVNAHLDEELSRRTSQLEVSEARYRKYVDHAPHGIFVADSSGNYVEVNDAACQMSGYTQEELLSFGLSSELSARDSTLFNTAKKRGRASGEVQIRAKDGQLRWWTIDAVKITEEQIVAFCADFTERKKAEERRVELETQLQHAQKMESIGRLAGGVAHDFNNLLSPILVYSELLQQEIQPTDPRYRPVEQIWKAGQRAVSLTRQLLAFGHKQLLEIKTLELNQIVEGVLPMLRRLLREDVRIETNLGQAPLHFAGDVVQIEQILINLAVNAQDSMADGGTIRVSTESFDVDGMETDVGAHEIAPGRYVTLIVSDTGCGMDSDTVARIFEPFFTTKERGKGTGLGLAMAYGIVEQLKGRIIVDSEPGKGTAFKLYFVACDGGMDDRISRQPSKEPLHGDETILLVEDDEDVRQSTGIILRRFGYEVVAAENGAAAIELMTRREEPIHLLLTDVIMPGINGAELRSRLAVSAPELKVLYMSGYPDDVISHHGILDEGIDFVHKPFTGQELAHKLRFILDR